MQSATTLTNFTHFAVIFCFPVETVLGPIVIVFPLPVAHQSDVFSRQICNPIILRQAIELRLRELQCGIHLFVAVNEGCMFAGSVQISSAAIFKYV